MFTARRDPPHVCCPPQYRSGLNDPEEVPQGPGYYRHEDAPPPDPLEQSRAILQQVPLAGGPLLPSPLVLLL